MTCWRRLPDWNEAGVWQRLHEVLLPGLNAASRPDRSRCVVDSSHVRALKGDLHGAFTGRPGPGRLEAPSDHRWARHPARGPADWGQPQRRHSVAAAAPRDPAGPRLRHRARDRPPRDRHGTGLGIYRWVVERTFAWLHGLRRPRVRWERRADIHEAFLKLACCLITRRQMLFLTCPADSRSVSRASAD